MSEKNADFDAKNHEFKVPDRGIFLITTTVSYRNDKNEHIVGTKCEQREMSYKEAEDFITKEKQPLLDKMEKIISELKKTMAEII